MKSIKEYLDESHKLIAEHLEPIFNEANQKNAAIIINTNDVFLKACDFAMQSRKQDHDIEIEKLRAELRATDRPTQKQLDYILSMLREEKGFSLTEEHKEGIVKKLAELKAKNYEELLLKIRTKEEASKFIEFLKGK